MTHAEKILSINGAKIGTIPAFQTLFLSGAQKRLSEMMIRLEELEQTQSLVEWIINQGILFSFGSETQSVYELRGDYIITRFLDNETSEMIYSQIKLNNNQAPKKYWNSLTIGEKTLEAAKYYLYQQNIEIIKQKDWVAYLESPSTH